MKRLSPNTHYLSPEHITARWHQLTVDQRASLIRQADSFCVENEQAKNAALDAEFKQRQQAKGGA